jgi:ABC-type glutathione transport system ATPase component
MASVSISIRGELLGLVGESGVGSRCTALSDHASDRAAGKDRQRRNTVRRQRPAQTLRRRDARDARRRHRDDLSGSDDVAQSVFTVGEQIAEALRCIARLSRKEARRPTIEAMREVAIPDPARASTIIPPALGGMRSA